MNMKKKQSNNIAAQKISVNRPMPLIRPDELNDSNHDSDTEYLKSPIERRQSNNVSASRNGAKSKMSKTDTLALTK